MFPLNQQVILPIALIVVTKALSVLLLALIAYLLRGKSCHRMIGMPFQIVEVKLLGRIKTYEKIFDLLLNNNFLNRICHSGIF